MFDERSFQVGIDRLSDGGGLYGFALGLGEAGFINRNHESHVYSGTSLSTYGRFEDGIDALQFILGFSKLEFDSDRLMERAS